MNMNKRRSLCATAMVIALAGCDHADSPAASAAETHRIIASETAKAASGQFDKGIELEVGGNLVLAGTGVQTGFRNSGEGHLMVSVEASRIDDRQAIKSSVVIHRLIPAQGPQSIGDDEGEAPWIELTGVPGYAGATLRSVEGGLEVQALSLSDSNLPTEGDIGFEGSFVPVQGEAGAGSPIPVAGRIRFKSGW